MSEITPASGSEPAESSLRRELARSNAALGAVGPVLRHLLASDASAIFGDDILAGVRGILTGFANRLMDAWVRAGGQTERAEHEPAAIAALTDVFTSNAALLGHVHALMLEWRFTVRLQSRSGIDPVLTPMIQALVASPDAAIASDAMKLLAAQARFGQAMRRMDLPLEELPKDLFHAALLALGARTGANGEAEARSGLARTELRLAYNGDSTRLGLLARLIERQGDKASEALCIAHSGAALFFTALALASGQDRDLAILSAAETHSLRLVLSLRAAGLERDAMAEQFHTLHPDTAIPRDIENLESDRAAALLSFAPGTGAFG